MTCATARLAGRSISASAALAGCAALLAALALAAPADATSGAPALVVSSNWAGYAVAGAGVSSNFTRVAGSWTQPAASCTARGASYSAVWVGLGGFSNRSRSLEQIGSEADCARSGATAYFAWLELVPQAPIDLRLRVRPGDRLTASVTVRGRAVTLDIGDLSTRASFGLTRRVSAPDASSAEWIVEAPSICIGTSACSTLALTDFGTVSFSGATASAGGHTGTIGDPRWSATELELRQGAHEARGPRPEPRFAGVRTPVAAVPSPLSGLQDSFAVTWGERATEQPSQVTPPVP